MWKTHYQFHYQFHYQSYMVVRTVSALTAPAPSSTGHNGTAAWAGEGVRVLPGAGLPKAQVWRHRQILACFCWHLQMNTEKDEWL